VTDGAAEAGLAVAEYLDTLPPKPPATNFAVDAERVRCDRCGDAKVLKGRLADHHRTKRCRESAAAGAEAEPEPEFLARFRVFLAEETSKSEATRNNILMWLRRLRAFAGGTDDPAAMLCDTATLREFWLAERDGRALGVASLARIPEVVGCALDFFEIHYVDEACAAAGRVTAMRRYLPIVKSRVRAGGREGGRSLEELKEANEWATRATEPGARPAAREVRRAGAYLIFATTLCGTPVRSGTLNGLTPEQAARLVRDGHVSTKNFKTSKKYGYATIVAPAWLRALYERYRGLRARLLAAEGAADERVAGRFFLASARAPLERVSEEVKALTERHAGVRVNVTGVRKIVETFSAEHLGENDRRAVNRAENHSGCATAWRWRTGRTGRWPRPWARWPWTAGTSKQLVYWRVTRGHRSSPPTRTPRGPPRRAAPARRCRRRPRTQSSAAPGRRAQSQSGRAAPPARAGGRPQRWPRAPCRAGRSARAAGRGTSPRRSATGP
jgi:hypothetical protein